MVGNPVVLLNEASAALCSAAVTKNILYTSVAAVVTFAAVGLGSAARSELPGRFPVATAKTAERLLLRILAMSSYPIANIELLRCGLSAKGTYINETDRYHRPLSAVKYHPSV